MRIKLECIANTGRDLTFEISEIARATRKCSEILTMELQAAKKSIKYIHHRRASLCTMNLDLDTLSNVAYRDEAFENYTDLSSDLGRKLLLIDTSNKEVFSL